MDARRDFIHLCMSRMDEKSASKALEAFDVILARYSLTPTETALTTYNPTDEPLLTYYLESQKLDGKKKSTRSATILSVLRREKQGREEWNS